MIEPALDLIEGPVAAECGFQPSFPRVFGAASSSFRDPYPRQASSSTRRSGDASRDAQAGIWCGRPALGCSVSWSHRAALPCRRFDRFGRHLDPINWPRRSIIVSGRVRSRRRQDPAGARTTHDPSARSLTHTTFLCTPFPDTHAQESARSTRAWPRSFLPLRVLAPLVPRDPPLPPPSPWLAGYDTFQD